MWGITINGKHSFSDLRLTCESCSLEAPEPRTYSINVPGRDGIIDTTEARGRITYQNRALEVNFIKKYPTRSDFDCKCSELNVAYHGREVTIITDSDPEHMLTGRARWQHSENAPLGNHTLTVDCAPYRLNTTVTEHTYTVDGELAVTLQNSQMAATPTFITDVGGMRVRDTRGAIYSILQTGGYVIPEIYLDEGANTLVFLGAGAVTVRWREGVL